MLYDRERVIVDFVVGAVSLARQEQHGFAKADVTD